MLDNSIITRRNVLAGGAALAGAAAVPGIATAALPKQPNVIFIMADDLGAFDLSCYGRPDYKTPRIDSLATDGMKFRYGYSSSASCTPTRVGLFSGRYPNRVPVGAVEGGGSTSETVGYSPQWPSLARMMKTAGYRTALVGKWNLGPIPTFSPLKSGYDEFFGFSGGAIDYWSHDWAIPFFPNGERFPDLYDGDKQVRREGYSTDFFTQRGCEFVARKDKRPFFLSMHYSAPHWPWQTRTDKGEPRTTDFHFDGGSMAIYADMMRALDDGVGQLLDTLDHHDLARDTIVVFTSDNGGERFSYMWPLRGRKSDVWEGGVRVPLLVRWPARVKPGTETAQVSLSMDWLPTLAAVGGGVVDRDTPPDGVDLSGQLFGMPPVYRTVFWMTPGGRSALSFPWKYVREGDREYLFNLLEDESENANFKRTKPDIFAKLKDACDGWSQTMLPSPRPFSRERMNSLEALDFPELTKPAS